MCIYIYTYINVNIHIHSYVCVFWGIYVFCSSYSRVRSANNAYLWIYIYIYIYIYSRARPPSAAYGCMCAYIHTCTCIYIHKYVYTQTYIYVYMYFAARIDESTCRTPYGVATISWLLKILGLLCTTCVYIYDTSVDSRWHTWARIDEQHLQDFLWGVIASPHMCHVSHTCVVSLEDKLSTHVCPHTHGTHGCAYMYM